MSFFNKLFKTGETTEKTAPEPRKVDFVAALSMHLRGDLDSALGNYLKIVEEQPDNWLAPFFASAITARKGNSVEAVERLRSISGRIAEQGGNISRELTLNLVTLMNNEPFLGVPAVAEIIVSYGDGLKKDGFIRESAVCFEIATGLVPDNAHILHKLGDTLHDLGVYDYAESVLQEALKYAPNHWESIYTYAVLLHDLKRFDEACTYYEKAVKMNPDHAKCHNNYGAVLMMTNRLDDALTHYTLAEELDPEFPLVKINLGNIHILRQEYEAARAKYLEAIALDTHLVPAYIGLASVEQTLGSDSGRICELYLKALELNPSIPEAHHSLGNLLAREGKQEALEHFSAAVQLNNALTNLQRDFGNACLQLGRKEDALEHLRLALQQNPDDTVTQETLLGLEEETRTA